MRLVLIAVLLGAAAACAPVGDGMATTPRPSRDAPQVGTYQGVLPCADCEGIQARLTLYGPPSFRYRLERTYLGRGPEVFREEGVYYILRGAAQDPDATVFALGADGGESFQSIGDDELRKLDGEHRPIASAANHSLRRSR